jgi:hypothetical protein
MTPTMNFNLDVLSNGRLPLTIDQKYVGSVSSLRKLVWWKQSFCSKSCTSTRWSERVTLRHFDYYFLCRPSRGVLQRSIQRKCSSNEVQLSQKMKRMTSITYCVPIICVISAKKIMNDSRNAGSSIICVTSYVASPYKCIEHITHCKTIISSIFISWSFRLFLAIVYLMSISWIHPMV